MTDLGEDPFVAGSMSTIQTRKWRWLPVLPNEKNTLNRNPSCKLLIAGGI